MSRLTRAVAALTAPEPRLDGVRRVGHYTRVRGAVNAASPADQDDIGGIEMADQNIRETEGARKPKHTPGPFDRHPRGHVRKNGCFVAVVVLQS